MDPIIIFMIISETLSIIYILNTVETASVVVIVIEKYNFIFSCLNSGQECASTLSFSH